jgi:hypothetical protein
MFPKDKEITTTVDGIDCTPDIPTGIEVKSTRQSMRKFTVEAMEHWKKQILGYCKSLGKTEYDLVVMFVCGNYCLAPETRILLEDLTWRELKYLNVGDRIIAIDEFPLKGRKKRKLRYTTITSLAPTKLESSLIRMEDGRSIVSSNEHLWLEVVASGGSNWIPKWTKTSDLKKGSGIRQLEAPWETAVGYKAGYLSASLDSEGNVETKNDIRTTLRVGYSQKSGTTYNFVKKLFDYYSISVGYFEKQSVNRIKTKGMGSTLRLLGSIRPQRLLDNFNAKGGIEGMGLPATRSIARVHSVTPVGIVDLIGIETGTKTLIAEGLITHNSPPFPDLECYHIGTSQEEVDANWGHILAKRDILHQALALQIPPMPDCEDWEYQYCDLIDNCPDTVCWRKKYVKEMGKK